MHLAALRERFLIGCLVWIVAVLPARSDEGPVPAWLREPAEPAWSRPAAPAFSTDGQASLWRGQSEIWGVRDFGTLFQWSGSAVPGGPRLDAPLVTDRPTFTPASVTVGAGVAQVEFGYTYYYNSDGEESTRLQSFGEPLLRYGLFADWLELRLQLSPLEMRDREDGDTEMTTGTDDLLIGLKLALTPQNGILPEMALIPQARVPTGSPAFTQEQFRPGLIWAYSWQVNDWLSMAGSTQINRVAQERIELAPPANPVGANSYLQVAQSWVVGYQVTDRLKAFTEWYGLFPHVAHDEFPEYYFDTGMTFLVTDNIQWDVRSGWGLNEAAVDYFVGTGLAFRFR